MIRSTLRDSLLENQIELYCQEALLNRKNLESLHSFVSGYIISSHLKSFLSQFLPDDRKISWGQYILPSGELSKETDLIIFRNEPVREYKYANFILVESDDVSMVIECKSFYEGPKSSLKEAKKHYDVLDPNQVILYFERVRRSLNQSEINKIKEKYGLNIYSSWYAEESVPLNYIKPNIESMKQLIKKIASNTRLPYFNITPTFSLCLDHGYLKGTQEKCPQCGKETNVYSRVVGYIRPIKRWNNGKQEEFKERKTFDSDLALSKEFDNIKKEKLVAYTK